MRMSRIDWLLLPFLAAGTLALMAFAFRVAGFLGVGNLGGFDWSSQQLAGG